MTEPIKVCIGRDANGENVHVLISYKALLKTVNRTYLKIGNMDHQRKIILLYAHILDCELLPKLAIHDRLFKREHISNSCNYNGKLKGIAGGYYAQTETIKPHSLSRYDIDVRIYTKNEGYKIFKSTRYLKY